MKLGELELQVVGAVFVLFVVTVCSWDRFKEQNIFKEGNLRLEVELQKSTHTEFYFRAALLDEQQFIGG